MMFSYGVYTIYLRSSYNVVTSPRKKKNYRDIVLKIQIDGCQEIVSFISCYWSSACTMFLCKQSAVGKALKNERLNVISELFYKSYMQHTKLSLYIKLACKKVYFIFYIEFRKYCSRKMLTPLMIIVTQSSMTAKEGDTS